EEGRLVLQVDRHVLERDVLAGEVRLQAVHHLQVTVCYVLCFAGPGQLVREHAAVLEPELPHAPTLRLVGDVRHRHAPDPRIDGMSVGSTELITGVGSTEPA